jgi:Spy/CpxP family protein refolding chaperone
VRFARAAVATLRFRLVGAGKEIFMFIRVLLIVALATGVAFAQRGGGRGGGGGGMPPMGGGMPRPQSRIQQFADKLKLNEEQGHAVEKILSAGMEKAMPIRNQIDQSRANIAGALIENKSADEIKKLMDAHTALEAQLDLVEVELFSKIYSTLKPNQQSKAAEAFELMAGVFDRMGAGAGGGGGRGGRGQ